MPRWIEEAITKYTGATDAADVAEIMDFMADECHTFNGLSPDRFRRLALSAWEAVRYLKTPAGRAYMASLDAQYA